MSVGELSQIRRVRREQFAADQRNPQQLPSIIKEIHLREADIKRHFFEIGKLLYKVRKNRLVPQGEFREWIKRNFTFSYNTANNLMNIYSHCLKKPELVQTIPISILYTIATPGFPEDLREYLFENSNYLKKIKNKDMKIIMKRFKAGKLTLKSPEIKSLINFENNQKKFTKHQKLVAQNIESLRKLQETVRKVAERIKWPIKEDKTEVTEEQDVEIEKTFKLITKHIEMMVPNRKIVKSTPKFKLIKGKKQN